MDRRLRFCAIGLVIAFAVASLEAGETPADRRASFGEIAQSIPQQALAERATCEAMLAEGLASGMWTAEEKQAAENWLDYIFDMEPDAPAPRGRPAMVDFESRVLLPRAMRPTDPTAATHPVFSWLRTRVATLETTRQSLLDIMCRIVLEEAERVWLSARDAADLDPALRGIIEAKEVLGFKWGRLAISNRNPPDNASRAMRPGLRNVSDVFWDFYDCWSIIGSPEPLLLPDPATDPAGFAAARIKWQELIAGPQRFLKRPAVARRFVELDDQFRAEFSDLQRKLNDAILRDVSAEEFEKDFQRLKSHVIDRRPTPGRPPSPPFRGMPPNPNSDTPPDYRENLRAQPNQPQGAPPPKADLQWNEFFAEWLEWRQAREAEDRKRIEAARRKLLGKVDSFKPRVAAFLKKHLAEPAPLPPPPIAPAVEPEESEEGAMAKLVAALRLHARANREAQPDANILRLLGTLIEFDKGKNAPISDEVDLAHVWNQIAAGTDGRTLLELRDESAREALFRIVPELSVEKVLPLTLLCGKALEISITREQPDIAAKVMLIDAIWGAFSGADRFVWRDTIKHWKQATERSSSDASAAKEEWIRLLRATTSPAAAALAVRKMKAIPAKPQ